MRTILKEYIREILNEEKSADQKLLSNQTIEWAAEWAVYEAMNGGQKLFSSDKPENAIPKDKRLTNPWGEGSHGAKKIFLEVYQALISVSQNSLKSSFKETQPKSSKKTTKR